MVLTSGAQLGPYEILSPLGAGGMGEVYRARDTKLNREVALKVLPEAFAANAERMARFEREAQVLASVNHPNMAAIYGLEESTAVRALVMELVEGPTLADRIAQGPVAIEEALPVAKQIAEALEYAHEKSIIHRDLKPANVKVTPEGTVKVLDFGLAKALAPDTSGTHLANSPTISIAATQAGVILGTAAYMSPEQAKGKIVDRRTDIWAFGCVLYEMLGGKQAFEGETVSDVLAAVIMKDPDWNALAADTPAGIQKLLRRCLQKDPKQRLRDIGDARIAIEETLSGTGDAEADLVPAQGRPQGPPLQPWRRALPWAAALLCVGLAGVFAIGYFRAISVPARSVRSYILPPEKTTFAFEAKTGTPVLSPDGRKLLFAARNSAGVERLWIRPLDSAAAQPLEDTEGASFPFWSPDSRFVGYFAQGKLMKIDTSGGPNQTVCDAPSGRGGAWSLDGRIVFTPERLAGLEQVAAAGGTPTPLVPLNRSNQQLTLRWPVFLPDGHHFLYFAGNPLSEVAASTNGIYLGSLDGKDRKFLVQADSNALYAPPGFLLFLKGATLVAQPIDTRRLELTGEAVPVAEEVANPRDYRLGHFSVSQYGDLVYELGGQDREQVAWLDAGGKQLGEVGEPGTIQDLRLSPDGETLAEVAPAGKNVDLWLLDLARGVRTRFTFNPAEDMSPAWSPDGTKIAFSSMRSGQFDIYVKPTNGTGTAQPLVQDNARKFVDDWSGDGRYLAYMRDSPQGKNGSDIWILPLFGDKKPFPFLASPFNEAQASFSPDDRWLAYVSDESGKFEVYVVPFPQGNGKWQVSTGGGGNPRWRRDGKELFYVSPADELMAVEVREKSGSLEVGNPRTLFRTNSVAAYRINSVAAYDVAPDGNKFVVLTQPAQSSAQPITLVTNWTALLKKQ
ncbi:MAG: protein kinase [Terriglobia bacterium]|jgi:Tol biopolymer transport system component